MTDFAAVADQIAQAIEEAPISFQPWRHVFVENIFPLDFYRKIEAAITESSALFAEQVHSGDRDIFTAPYNNRSEFRVSEDLAESKVQGPCYGMP